MDISGLCLSTPESSTGIILSFVKIFSAKPFSANVKIKNN
jgi:hypothetical protein